MEPTANYTLYKNPIQLDTLAIVRYIYYTGINLQPTTCIERNYPESITEIPSILDHDINQIHTGLSNVIKYYEDKTGITNLLEKSLKFAEENPDFKIEL